MTKLSYWERRHLQTKAKEIKSTEAYEKALQPELNGLYRELHGEMEKWYVRYANTKGIDKDEAKKAMAGINTKHWQLTLKQFEARAKSGGYQDQLDAEYFRSRVARLQDLEQQLQQHTQSFASQRTETMRNGLAKQYEDTYMRTNYNIQASKGGFTANFAHFNEAQLKMAVSSPWGKDGKDFSKRIWKNYQKELPSYLMDAVLRGTVLGWSPAKVSQMFHARFQDIKRSNIHNLVASEMGHVAEEATAQGYEENDIEQYEYMATLESHTCDTCGRLDGQIFRLDKRVVGVNYPLIHARCRCTTVPYIEGLPDVTERWSRDPDTGKGKMVKDIKFNQWKKLVGEGKQVPMYKAMPIPLPSQAMPIRKQLADKLLESNFGDVFDEDRVNSVVDSLAKAPKVLQDQFLAHGDKLHFGCKMAESLKSENVDLNGIHLKESSFEGKKPFQPKQVVFHEMAHFLDKSPLSVEEVSPSVRVGLKEALNKDFWNYFGGGQEYTPETFKLLKKTKPRRNAKDYESKKKEYDQRYDEFFEGRSKFEKKLADKIAEWKSQDPKRVSDLSDMLEATGQAGARPLGYGHSEKYWKDKQVDSLAGKRIVTNHAQEKEFFAEVSSELATNPEALELTKEVFPTGYKKYFEIAEIVKKRKDM